MDRLYYVVFTATITNFGAEKITTGCQIECTKNIRSMKDIQFFEEKIKEELYSHYNLQGIVILNWKRFEEDE